VPARKKTIRSHEPRSRVGSLGGALGRLPGGLPASLQRLVQQVRSGLRQLERQVAKGRAERERRFEEQQWRLRRDLAGLLRRLGKAIDPDRPAPGRRKTTRSARRA
jgi:hypothetical protein